MRWIFPFTLRQALKKQLFYSWKIIGLPTMKIPSNSVKTALFLGNALPRARGLYRSGRTEKSLT